MTQKTLKNGLFFAIAAMLIPTPYGQSQSDSIDGLQLRSPTWSTNVVHWESSVLLDSNEPNGAMVRLARPAKKILAVRAANRTRTLDPAVDILLAESGLSFAVLIKDLIPAISTEAMYKAPNAPQSYRHRTGNENQWLLYAPGRWFHDRNVEVTYEVIEHVVAPELIAVHGALPRCMTRLAIKQPLRIGVSGDSISTGLDSSLTADAPPHQAGYVGLIQSQLARDFSTDIQVTNRSVAGWSISNGNEDAEQLLSAPLDLVIIAYGMNDVGRRDPKWFQDQLQRLIRTIQSRQPEAEIAIVSPMLGNPEWIHTPAEMFGPYRDAMLACVGPGVALADVTEVWTWMNRHKHFLDMTGNGLNHPNDFGHRLYAQCLLQLLPAPVPVP
jgi:acyl-CoA thioesterase I